jgi:hypothetical protein
MMRIKEYITFLLCIVLMLILSSMPLSLASHSIDHHHHHHSAQTHTTGICAWMCTAAQTISTDSQIFSPNFSLLFLPSFSFRPELPLSDSFLSSTNSLPYTVNLDLLPAKVEW